MTRSSILNAGALQTKLLQTPVQGASTHAELIGRLAHVAAVPREHLLDEDLLRLLERHLLGGRGGGRRGAQAEIDLAGARQVRETMKEDALLVFLKPPSWAELVRRLTGRGTEPPEVVQRRLAVAKEELAAAGEFDVTLVNTSVDEVCRQMVTLIVSSVNP